MKRLSLKITVAASLVAASAAVVSSQSPRAHAQTLRPDGNNAQAAAPGQTVCGLPPSRKLDEYGTLTAGERQSRLDKFAAALDAEDEDTSGFIITYAGRGAAAGEARRRADQTKEYLVEQKAFRNSRLNTLDCGHREQPATEFWLTPAGAAPPLCAANVRPGGVNVQPRRPRRPPPRRASTK